MSILRIKKEEKYAVISNEPLNNKDLTWEARGIMAYLLSKPDGWECRNYDLVNQGPASEHVIRRVIKELQEAGYIHRYRKSYGRGKIEWVTEIYETPELNTAFRNGTFSSLENIETESFDVEKSAHIVSTDSVVSTDKLVSTDLSEPPKNSESQKLKTDRLDKQHLNTLADQIATIIQADITTIGDSARGQLKKLTLALSQKPNVELKLAAYPEWWYANDWRGKQGQPPTVWTLSDTWGQFEAAKVAPPQNSNAPTLSSAELQRYKELMAENS
jgi:hypothetical protein